MAHFRSRPYLPDPEDEFILELAGGADAIVTHNVRDFKGADAFGIEVLTPAAFCGFPIPRLPRR